MTSLYPWMMQAEARPIVTKRDIVLAVCRQYDVSIEDVLGPGRRKRIAHARQEAMWKLRQLKDADGKPRLSLPAIGMYFDRDHTTVLHALRAVEARMAEAVAA